jgi:hypothetical protein
LTNPKESFDIDAALRPLTGGALTIDTSSLIGMYSVVARILLISTDALLPDTINPYPPHSPHHPYQAYLVQLLAKRVPHQPGSTLHNLRSATQQRGTH